MSTHVYTNRDFKIYKVGDKFVVHNTNLPFKTGHTHITNFKTAKFITKLAITKRVPKHLSKYLLVSLIRLSTDSDFITELKDKLKEM